MPQGVVRPSASGARDAKATISTFSSSSVNPFVWLCLFIPACFISPSRPQALTYDGDIFANLPSGNAGYVEAMNRFCAIFEGKTNSTVCAGNSTAAQIAEAAEDHVMSDAKAKAEAAALPAGWFSSANDAKKRRREMCARGRLAIFVGGGQGSGKDSLRPIWLKLLQRDKLDKECGFAFINYNHLVVGAGQKSDSVMRQAWANAKAREGKCAQARYGYRGGFPHLVNMLVTKAIAEGYSFVYDSSMSRPSRFVDQGWLNLINTRPEAFRHKIHVLGATIAPHLAAIHLWIRGAANAGNAEQGVFVALCKVYESHVYFARAFTETYSTWANVSLYNATEYKQTPKLIFQTDHAASPKIHSQEMFEEFKKISRTPAYVFEKNIKLYDEGRNLLQKYKFLNLDCGFCNCDANHFYRSEAGPVTELTLDGDLVGHSSENLCRDADDDSGGCRRWSQCQKDAGRRQCPLMCGLCYLTDFRLDECEGVKRQWDTGHGIIGSLGAGFKWAASWLVGGGGSSGPPVRPQAESAPRPKATTNSVPVPEKADPYVSKKYASVAETRIGNVLISYLGGINDAGIHDLQCRLQSKGYLVNMARHTLSDDDAAAKSFEAAIDDAALVVVGLCPQYMECEPCQTALSHAFSNNKDLMPVQVFAGDPMFQPKKGAVGMALSSVIWYELTEPTMKEECWKAFHRQLERQMKQVHLSIRQDPQLKKGWFGSFEGPTCSGSSQKTDSEAKHKGDSPFKVYS